MIEKIPANLVRQVFTLLLIIAVLLSIASELFPYMGGVLGAITLYVLLVGSQKKLENCNWKPSLAAGFLILISSFIILLPVAGIVVMFTGKIKGALDNRDVIEESIKSKSVKIEELTGYNFSNHLDASKIGDWVSNLIQGFASSSLLVFIAVGLMLFLLYYMLVYRSTWQDAAIRYLPLKEDNLKTIGTESMGLVKSNAIGIPLVALLQGVIAFIGYCIFGVENPFFWFVITAIGSMIPFMGTAIGILPVSIILLSHGQTGNAIGMLIYGIAVVGSTDNFFRLVVQRKLADIHPLITLIGVLIGVPLFGFIGLVFGPLLVSSVLLLIKLYREEYGAKT
jgi:predicted PurR-regulated permease PerM